MRAVDWLEIEGREADSCGEERFLRSREKTDRRKTIGDFDCESDETRPNSRLHCVRVAWAQIPLVASRYDTTRRTCRARRDERVASCLFQHGGRRRSSSARVYKFSLLCSGFASISRTTSGKREVDMSTSVHAVATPLNTCRASRACCDVCVAPWCKTSATQPATTFSCVKMHGLDSVSCRDVTHQVEFGLNSPLTFQAERFKRRKSWHTKSKIGVEQRLLLPERVSHETMPQIFDQRRFPSPCVIDLRMDEW